MTRIEREGGATSKTAIEQRRKSIEDTDRGERRMFTDLHLHTDRDFRGLDLAERMAERRNQSPAATGRSPRMARILSALTARAEKQETWRMAGEGSEARGRT